MESRVLSTVVAYPSPYLYARFKILVNTNISIIGVYGYIKNIGEYFDLNIDRGGTIFKVQNIGKHEYIDNWSLQINQEY